MKCSRLKTSRPLSQQNGFIDTAIFREQSAPRRIIKVVEGHRKTLARYTMFPKCAKRLGVRQPLGTLGAAPQG
jgi:hypothetical protein